MIDKLDSLIEDVSKLKSNLILLVGLPRSGKSRLLGKLSERRRADVLNVGAALGRELLTLTTAQRRLQASQCLKTLAEDFERHGLLLMDNLELLFDQALRLDPLDLLKRQAHGGRVVVAVWPGECQDGRLAYASSGHPEHRSFGVQSLVPFEVE